MAYQNANPPLWDDSMGDGCSGVLDRLPSVGDISDCCNEHDKAFHYGGDEADWRAANKGFYDCIHKKRRYWFCYQVSKLVAWERRAGVRAFGRSAFNWLGSGPPLSTPSL